MSDGKLEHEAKRNLLQHEKHQEILSRRTEPRNQWIIAALSLSRNLIHWHSLHCSLWCTGIENRGDTLLIASLKL